MQLKVWCEFCDAHQPAAPIKLEVKDINGYWGDLYCSVCGLVIATLTAQYPGRVEVIPDGNLGHGCHCDLEPGQKPDACVLDTTIYSDCVHAERLHREDKSKWQCDYWKPIG